MIKLERSEIPLVSPVDDDNGLTAAAIAPFDLSMDDVTEFYPFRMPELPEDYNVGLIVGSSGSGKSLLLKQFVGSQRIGGAFHPRHSIAAHFGSPQRAQELLYAVGMNSIPKWKLPYYSLSNGEQHRVYVARHLENDGTIDEFTSVVDRDVAISLSTAVGKYIRKAGLKRVVFASCHRDIMPYLQPDWIIDTDAETIEDGFFERPVWWSEYLKGDQVVGRIGLQHT